MHTNSLKNLTSEETKEKRLKNSLEERKKKALNGGVNGKHAPFGYKVGKYSLLEKDETRNDINEIIYMIYLYASHGMSPQNIGRAIKDIYDLRDTRRNHSSPTSLMIIKILTNPIYKGTPAFQMYEESKMKHPSLWIVRDSELEHLKYIDEELYKQANEKLWEKSYIQQYIKDE